MNAWYQDVKYGVRTLTRAPGYFLVSVLSLALGIGANVAVFTVGNALLLRPMAVPAGDKLIRAYYGHHSPFAYPDYADLRDGARSVVDLAAMRPMEVGIGEGENQRRATAEAVTANYFRALGLTPPLGRTFASDEGDPLGIHRVAVISDVLWRRDYGASRKAVGQSITVNSERYEIIGIAPADFTGAMFGRTPALWVPISEAARLSGADLVRRERGGGLYTFGQLAHGASREQALAALNVVAGRLSAAYPDIHKDMTISVDRARGMPAEQWAAIAVVTTGLLLLVSFVLLIACANVVNIALARATVRRRELAVRFALGASRWRVVRQLMAESAMIAFAAVALGMVLSNTIVGLAGRALPADFPLSLADLTIDGQVVAFTMVAGVAAMLFCGLAPALLASRPNLVPALKEAGGGDHTNARLRGTLVVAQVAMCTVLLVGSGLFVRSLGHVSDLNPGFDPTHVIDMPLDVRAQNLDETQATAFYSRLVERARATPRVESATLARLTPLSFDNMGMSFDVEGRAARGEEDRADAGFNIVAPQYFDVLGISLFRGRDFSESDSKTAPFVAIINETMAKRYWPNADPIGRRFGADVWGKPAEVIGVVKDSKYTTLGEEHKAFMYLPLAQHFSSTMVLQVKVAGDPAAAIPAIRDVTRAVAPGMAPPQITRLASDIGIAFLPARVGAGLLGSFGLLALILAIGGVYGVTAYAVAQRTREIGIRSALGGTSRDIVRFVLSGSLRHVAIGTAVGLVLALGVGRLLESFLYGVSAADPVTFALVPLGLAAAALLACIVPARRATLVDPLVALRAE